MSKQIGESIMKKNKKKKMSKLTQGVVDAYYTYLDRIMFHRSWYIMKTESLMKKGFTEEEAFKIYRMQKYMKKMNLNKYFILKGKK